ncbi:MAG: hypothetical protein JNL26_07595 [Gemmatimonadetes bacterium]|nr:hypothetical protein [Gemmatimonadota bacterium]
MRSMLRAPITLAAALALVAPAVTHAQLRVSPNGINVAAQGATTAILTYSGVPGAMAEGLFCTEVVPATPATGLRCAPGSILGQLPARYARSTGAIGTVTDVLTVPASVARRAYQSAAAGGAGVFYFVRRFRADDLGEAFAAVTLRLARGGARTPLAVTDVKLQFLTEDPVQYVATGDVPSEVEAVIRYNGSGRLSGRWEVVYPGEVPPGERERRTEVPPSNDAEFGDRRYTQLSRFNVFLPPTGQVTIPGPDASRLPTLSDGVYYLLLRLESAFDAESPIAGGTIIGEDGPVVEAQGRLAGGAAPFPLPVLSYVVGSGSATTAAPRRAADLRVRRPAAGSEAPAAALRFVWAADGVAAQYRVEVEGPAGERVLAALVPSRNRAYTPPPWFAARAPEGQLRWRVLALDRQGRAIARSEWASFKLAPARRR